MFECHSELRLASDAPGPSGSLTVGAYKLLEVVGEGACGVVYMAEQLAPGRRRVAFKLLKAGGDDARSTEWLRETGQRSRRLEHPNLARLLEVGAVDSPGTADSGGVSPGAAGRSYFVSELVRGVPITWFCDEQRLRLGGRLRLVLAVCRALQHAHSRGVLHGGLKPTNVLVTMNGDQPVPKVTDFGWSGGGRGTQTAPAAFRPLQRFLAAPAYLSPEAMQSDGTGLDERTDVYGLGALLYELWLGQPPLAAGALLGNGFDSLARAIRERPPLRPGAWLLGWPATAESALLRWPPRDEADLEAIVMKALEKEPGQRQSSMAELAEALDELLARNTPKSSTSRLPRRLFRRS